MTPGERNEYFGRLWPAACEVCDWNPKDDGQRRAVTLECMRLVRGPAVTASSPAFGPDEVTALFVYLRHLGDPSSFDKSAEWARVQEDYRTYNRARQADWHERELYGRGKNRFDRNRFRGKASAAGGSLDSLDPEEVRKRHMTFASRHQKKARVDRAVMRMVENPDDLARIARSKTDVLQNTPAPAVIVLPARAEDLAGQNLAGQRTARKPAARNRVKADVPF